MQNGAYTLASLSALLGLVLLTGAGQGSSVASPLGAALLIVAGLLMGLGKGIDLLGHVREGATDADDPP